MFLLPKNTFKKLCMFNIFFLPQNCIDASLVSSAPLVEVTLKDFRHLIASHKGFISPKIPVFLGRRGLDYQN